MAPMKKVMKKAKDTAQNAKEIAAKKKEKELAAMKKAMESAAMAKAKAMVQKARCEERAKIVKQMQKKFNRLKQVHDMQKANMKALLNDMQTAEDAAWREGYKKGELHMVKVWMGVEPGWVLKNGIRMGVEPFIR